MQQLAWSVALLVLADSARAWVMPTTATSPVVRRTAHPLRRGLVVVAGGFGGGDGGGAAKKKSKTGRAKKGGAKKGGPSARAVQAEDKVLQQKSERLYEELEKLAEADEGLLREFVVTARLRPEHAAGAEGAAQQLVDWVPATQLGIWTVTDIETNKPFLGHVTRSLVREAHYSMCYGIPSLSKVSRSLLEWSVEPSGDFDKYVWVVTQGEGADSAASKDESWKTLGIEPGSDAASIKKAYRDLCRKYHPDANPDPAAKGMFAQVQTAYSTLSAEVSKSGSWYEGLGGQDRREFTGPLDLTVDDAMTALEGKGWKAACCVLDPELVGFFARRNQFVAST